MLRISSRERKDYDVATRVTSREQLLTCFNGSLLRSTKGETSKTSDIGFMNTAFQCSGRMGEVHVWHIEDDMYLPRSANEIGKKYP